MTFAASGAEARNAKSAGHHSTHHRHEHHEARKRAPVIWPLQIPESQYAPLKWADVAGWADDDPLPAFKTFRASCKPIAAQKSPLPDSKALGASLREPCIAARAENISDTAKAREFFEKNFIPLQIARIGDEAGFVTGYYEPIVDGSRVQTDVYNVPVYRRPSNLFVRGYSQDAPNLPNKGPVYRKIGRRKLVPYYDRAAIEDGALAGRSLELAWIKDPVDAFFAHIQGSVRVRLPDGDVLRLNYDGHNGQTYTPVGRILVDQGIIPREKISMDAIRTYISQNPEAGRELMRQNRSYVFFRVAKELSKEDGAVGAQGLPLTAGRSIAVDRALHVYGTPFYIDAKLPIDGDAPTTPFQRLMIAQDTGSAIVGPARADIFFGAGKDAGSIAGRIQHPGRFAMLLPRSIDPSRAPPLPLPPARPADAPKAPETASGATP
jgi:membrane-bound lytic murein transglycosylase A